MAVNYNTAVKTDRMRATRDYFASGTLEILTSGDSLLVAFDITSGGGSINGDTWELAFDASTVEATGSGTAAKAQIKNSVGNAHLTGLTVGMSEADIIIDNTSIEAGQNVTLSSAAIQHA